MKREYKGFTIIELIKDYPDIFGEFAGREIDLPSIVELMYAADRFCWELGEGWKFHQWAPPAGSETATMIFYREEKII